MSILNKRICKKLIGEQITNEKLIEVNSFIHDTISGNGYDLKHWGDFVEFNNKFTPDWRRIYQKWLENNKNYWLVYENNEEVFYKFKTSPSGITFSVKVNEFEINKDELKFIRPCLKWVGGKTQIMENVFKLFPTEINNYYECFVGGGSVFLELLKRIECEQIKLNGNIVINDFNSALIDMYQLIKNDVVSLMEKLDEIMENYSKSSMKEYEKRHKPKITDNIEDMVNESKMYVYYYYRNLYRTTTDSVIKSALLIFLNKTCFRGVYREGPNGFNVPFGNNKNPSIYNKEQLQTLNKVFNKYNVCFVNKSFEDVIMKYKEGDFVYFDPPYFPLNEKSFTAYKKEGFADKHDVLVQLCDTLDNNNIKFLHSNSYCMFNLENYGCFNYERLLCKRLINSKRPSDTDYEMLIYN